MYVWGRKPWNMNTCATKSDKEITYWHQKYMPFARALQQRHRKREKERERESIGNLILNRMTNYENMNFLLCDMDPSTLCVLHHILNTGTQKWTAIYQDVTRVVKWSRVRLRRPFDAKKIPQDGKSAHIWNGYEIYYGVFVQQMPYGLHWSVTRRMASAVKKTGTSVFINGFTKNLIIYTQA